MSGIETVKIIVNAEKEAAELLRKAQNKADEIRKGLDVRVNDERQRALANAKKEADALLQRAEAEGKVEGDKYETEAKQKINRTVTKGSANKSKAVEKLLSIVLEG